MVRYIRAANYDYYPFLDTKEFVKLLWHIRTEAKRLGLKYEYYDNPDPNDLGGENRDKSNAIWIYDSNGDLLVSLLIEATKTKLTVSYDNNKESFKSFSEAKDFITQVLESVA